MAVIGETISLATTGLGIVFYSPAFMADVPPGSDFLAAHFMTEDDVQKFVQQGTVVGFSTGTPGTYLLEFHLGVPEDDELRSSQYKIRLGLKCEGSVVHFRDLYDLLDWSPDCPASQKLHLNDGFYLVTLCSNRPASGTLGDGQVIRCFLQPMEEFPRISSRGIPTLCVED